MLRMQVGEGHSQLCLDRLQLEAIHKVSALAQPLPSPRLRAVVSEIGGKQPVNLFLMQWLPFSLLFTCTQS